MQDSLSLTFAALSDPSRRAILARLSKGEASVTDLAEPFLDDMSLPAVTKHLKVLERAGLITRSREAQWRPCRLNAPALKDAADWMEQYRIFWEQSFDRLDLYLKKLTADKKNKKKEKKWQKNTSQMNSTSKEFMMLPSKWSGRHGSIPIRSHNGGGRAVFH